MGYLYKNFGGLNLEYVIGIIFTKEIVRAYIGVCMGCFAYTLSEKLKNIEFTKLAQTLLGLIEIGGYLFMIYMMTIRNKPEEFVMILLFLGLVTVTASQKSAFLSIYNNKIVKKLATLSLPLYLCHSSIIRFF